MALRPCRVRSHQRAGLCSATDLWRTVLSAVRVCGLSEACTGPGPHGDGDQPRGPPAVGDAVGRGRAGTAPSTQATVQPDTGPCPRKADGGRHPQDDAPSHRARVCDVRLNEGPEGT